MGVHQGFFVNGVYGQRDRHQLKPRPGRLFGTALHFTRGIDSCCFVEYSPRISWGWEYCNFMLVRCEGHFTRKLKVLGSEVDGCMFQMHERLQSVEFQPFRLFDVNPHVRRL